MKFWTALQYPLCQAALVSDGKIVKTIPPKPPQTPARWVMMVSEYDDKLVIGRRCHVELWNREGTELIRSVYHPWIYSLHDCLQIGSELLLACAMLDVVFRLDWEGNTSWEWWAYREELAAEPDFIHRDDWQTVQLTQNVEHEMAHLNSITQNGKGTILATLLRRKQIVELDLHDPNPQSRIIHTVEEHAPHDFQYHNGNAVYGTSETIVINGRSHPGYEYVKRIIPRGENRYLFTHEQGVTEIDSNGNQLLNWTLPRPFGIACLETESKIDGLQESVESPSCEESIR